MSLARGGGLMLKRRMCEPQSTVLRPYVGSRKLSMARSVWLAPSAGPSSDRRGGLRSPVKPDAETAAHQCSLRLSRRPNE